MSITAPFQRRVTNPLQRPLSSDLNLQAFYDSVTQAYMAGVAFSASPGGNPTFNTGFVGNSFRCFASPTTREVVVQKGIGFINAATPYDTENIDSIAGVNAGSYAPVVCQPTDPASAGLYVGIDELGAGLQRIDLVCVKAPNYPTAVENLGILNPTSSTFAFSPRPTQFTENAFSTTPGTPDFITVVTGTASVGTPTVPSVPAGYLEIGRVYVPEGDGVLSNSEVEDRRPVLIPNGGRAMTLSFDSDLSDSVVQGFDFGNNGIKAVVRSVYETPSSVELKYFEVYVSSGIVNPSVFELVPAGWSQRLRTNEVPTIRYMEGFMASIYSRSTVTRAQALPIFEQAGSFSSIIGPTVAKFVVVAGPVNKALVVDDFAALEITASQVDFSQCKLRFSLFAQEF